MKRLSWGAAVVAVALALPAVVLAATPSGTYKRKVHTKAFSGALNGTWTITLHRGEYTVEQQGTGIGVQGRYSIRGNQITVGGGNGQAFCKVNGVYSFTLHGSTLTFSRVNDPNKKCAGRVDVLTGGSFTKV